MRQSRAFVHVPLRVTQMIYELFTYSLCTA